MMDETLRVHRMAGSSRKEAAKLIKTQPFIKKKDPTHCQHLNMDRSGSKQKRKAKQDGAKDVRLWPIKTK